MRVGTICASDMRALALVRGPLIGGGELVAMGWREAHVIRGIPEGGGDCVAWPRGIT